MNNPQIPGGMPPELIAQLQEAMKNGGAGFPAMPQMPKMCGSVPRRRGLFRPVLEDAGRGVSPFESQFRSSVFL